MMQPWLIYWFIMLANDETKQMFFKWLAIEACPKYKIER